jgi:hypothetical protein
MTMKSNRVGPGGLTLVLAVVAGAAAPPAARADTLDRELLREAPEILQKLKKKHCRHVGVLKFLVHRDDETRPTDTAGTLNLSLAQRLELALILANENHPTDPAKQVGVIRDASAVAARIPGADHTTMIGRLALFAAAYEPAWGHGPVQADAFLTGVVRIGKDLQELRISIDAVFRNVDRMQRVARFIVATDADTLVETGESFQLRGAFDEGQVELAPEQRAEKARTEAIAAAARLKTPDGGQKHPAAEGAQVPVRLSIFYDGRPVVAQVQRGRAEVPEPSEGQRVKFVLERRDKGKVRYGAVLKVNGENTLCRQRLRDMDCMKWILEPGAGPIEIVGFQTTQGKADAYRILSRTESAERAFYYGPDVGTISLTVFPEKPAREEMKTPSDEELDEQALQRGVFPEKRPATLSLLKQRIREGKPNALRGIIESGSKVESKTVTVPFTPEPTPVLAVTIRYYRP